MKDRFLEMPRFTARSQREHPRPTPVVKKPHFTKHWWRKIKGKKKYRGNGGMGRRVQMSVKREAGRRR